MLRHLILITLLALLPLCADVSAQSGTFLTADDFWARAFSGNQTDPQEQVLWLKAEHKQAAKTILGHDFRPLRVRYRQGQERTAWILDEIGKERPITLGVVVEGGQIAELAVLVFRESRGGEIRHDFFTNQFSGLALDTGRAAPTLDGPVDGITGATLSVRAAKKVATLALFFHSLVFGAPAHIDTQQQASSQ